jgi:hypothetical protein
MFRFAINFEHDISHWDTANIIVTSCFSHTNIGNILEQYNLTSDDYFNLPKNHPMFIELYGWSRKKHYVMFLVQNSFHPIFEVNDITRYISSYL